MPGSFIQTAKRIRPVDLERIVFNGRKRDGQDAVAAGAQVIRMPVVKEREQTTTRFKHAGRLPAKRGVFMRTAARVIEEFQGPATCGAVAKSAALARQPLQPLVSR